MNSKWPSSSRPVWLQAGIPGDDVASAILCVLYAPIFGIHVNNAIVCNNIQLIITFWLVFSWMCLLFFKCSYTIAHVLSTLTKVTGCACTMYPPCCNCWDSSSAFCPCSHLIHPKIMAFQETTLHAGIPTFRMHVNETVTYKHIRIIKNLKLWLWTQLSSSRFSTILCLGCDELQEVVKDIQSHTESISFHGSLFLKSRTVLTYTWVMIRIAFQLRLWCIKRVIPQFPSTLKSSHKCRQWPSLILPTLQLRAIRRIYLGYFSIVF
jgi:hypothetical protein